MIKAGTVILVGILSLVTSSLHAACNYPDSVGVPDGSQATEADMLAAKQTVKAYIAQMEDYLKCMDGEAVAADPGQAADRQAARSEALQAMRRLADSYNEQVLAYKAVNE